MLFEEPEETTDIDIKSLFDEFEEIPMETEGEKEEQKEGESETIRLATKAQAGLFVSIFEMVVTRGASAYSGLDPEKYKFNKSEKGELTEVTEAFFEHENIAFTPRAAFIAAISMVLLNTGMKAHADKLQAIKKEKIKEARNKVQAAKENPEKISETEIREAASVISESIKEENRLPERRRFEIDKNGFYSYDPSGNYLGKDFKGAMPPPAILAKIEEMKKAGKTAGQINKAILKEIDEGKIEQQYA